MNTGLIIAIVIGAIVVMGTGKIKSKPPRGYAVGVIGVASPAWSHIGVLFGIVKGAALFAVYIGGTGLYLSTNPPFWIEWWPLALLVDILALALVAMPGLPRGYRHYMKHKPKNTHHAIDYLVGLSLSAMFIVGVAVHYAILFEAPGFSFSP